MAKAAARTRKAVTPDRQAPLVTVAGNGTAGFSGDGASATEAQLAFPADVAVGQGAVFIADHANHRVRRIDGAGVLTTVAGDGLRGFAGDGADAVRARLGFPSALAVGADGGVFVADEMNHRIRRIDPSGVIDTVVGDGSRGGDGDGGPADRARLDSPCALAVDGAGSLYVGEAGTPRVRRVGGDGIISTVVAVSGGAAGSGAADAGEAFLPAALVVDASGRLYIADPVGRRVLLLDPDGTLRVLAGPPEGSVGSAAVDWSAPCAAAIDAQGAVYVADMNGHRVWRLADGAARVVAGPDPTAGEAAQGGDAADTVIGASLAYPCGLAVDPAGRLLVADNFHHRIVALPLPTAPVQVVEPAPDEKPEPRPEAEGEPKPKPEPDEKPDKKQEAEGKPKPKPEPEGKPEPEEKPKPEPEEKPKPEPEEKPKPEPEGKPEPDREADSARGGKESAATAARLLVRQEGGVEISCGGSELLHVRVSSTDAWAPGRVEHGFTAPTGFVFDGRATCAYYRVDGSVVAAPEPTATVREKGRSMSVTDEPSLNTRGNPAAALVYTLGVRARPDAAPGRYTDGRALIAGQPEVRLKASVLGDDED
ncbi:serine/threonine protein kinase [Streptomyces sp. NPDC020362]|uniref:NHL domain-containing protein n=1 Tax=unclassified Streptomyces TaxID=2593676 RepID=UPI0033D49ECD